MIRYHYFLKYNKDNNVLKAFYLKEKKEERQDF